MGFVTKFSFAMVVAVAAVLGGMQLKERISLPEHLLHHEVVYEENFLSEEAAEYFRSLYLDGTPFPTNSRDLKFYKTKHEHIGEAQPVNSEGKCDHPYLAPTVDRKQCVFPGRLDVGRHYIMYGGVLGLKERYEVMASRVQSFGRYFFNVTDFPRIEELFADPNFQRVGKSVCPDDRQLLDPFQFNLILQVPGQTVAVHLDAPYMFGASRFLFPQWLLVAMVFSGLFQDRVVHQVQIVGYPHSWQDPEKKRGGEFVYWDENLKHPKRVPPTPRAASAVDGSKTTHAAMVYKPDVQPPMLDRSRENVLRYDPKADSWSLHSDDELLSTYTTDDLRMSVVYRARCFRDEAERELFHNYPEEDNLTLDTILSTFAKDLAARGLVKSEQDGLSMDRIQFGLLIMDTYIRYPLPPDSVVPYNYCAAVKLVPALESVLGLVC